MSKIGRNDKCYCGSGKKYKKCCLDKEKNHMIKSSFTDQNDVFPNVQNNVVKLTDIFLKYDLSDLVKAVFCINICSLNRSALEISISLNQCLMGIDKSGSKEIKSYMDFEYFFSEVSECLQVTSLDDYTMQDFGEVRISYKNKSYRVILGNGYENVYGVLQFMEQAAAVCKMEPLLNSMLYYSSNQIDYFYDINRFDEDFKVKFVLPSNQLFERVHQYFNEVYSIESIINLADAFKEYSKDASKSHFTEKEGTIWPIFNTSILVDFYGLMVQKMTKNDAISTVEKTIAYKLQSLSYLEDDANPSLLYPVGLVDSAKFISKEYYSFILCGRRGVVIGINGSKYSSSLELDEEIKRIKDLYNSNQLSLAEIVQRKSNGYKGVQVPNHLGLKILVFDDLLNLHQNQLLLKNGKDAYHSCTSADVIYFLSFMKNIDELYRYLEYEEEDKQGKLLSFGGVATTYLMWKESGEVVEKGAIEYSLMSIEHGYADSYVRDYFVDKLSSYPFEVKTELFSDFSRWNIRRMDRSDYYEYSYKMSNSYGGIGRLFSNNSFVFFAHNITMYSTEDYSDELMNLICLIDDLNMRNTSLYGHFYEKNNCFNGLSIHYIHLPFEYAKEHDITGYTQDAEKKYVYSEIHVDSDGIAIRFAVNSGKLLSDLEEAKDREVETTYFMELNSTLKKYFSEEYNELVDLISDSIHLPGGVGVFSMNLSYLYNDKHPGYRVSDKSYHNVRKSIAMICSEKDIITGRYEGKKATKIIRIMQSELISYFEDCISKYDRKSLHLQLLEIYSKIVHEVNIHRARYNSFNDIEETEKDYVKQRIVNLREEAKHHQRSMQYILETNLNLENNRKVCQPTDDEVQYLLAFANWLVVLQDAADICFNSKLEKSIEVNHDYVVDIIDSEDMIKRIKGLSKRIYENKDYSVKMDEIDKSFYEEYIAAFNDDFGFDFQLFMAVMEILQLGHESTFATNVGINVYKFDFEAFKQDFLNAYDVECSDQELKNVINFLVCDVKALKFWRGEYRTFLPINERVNRNVRFEVCPLILFENEYYFSPVAIFDLMNKWISGVLSFYPPFEIGMKKVMKVLTRWKKRYEDDIVKDIVKIFKDHSTRLVWPEAKLHKLDKTSIHPEELGDYDVIAYDDKRKELWIIECKVLSKVGSNHEVYMQQFNFFLDKKYDEKFQRRIDYLSKYYKEFLHSQGVDDVEDLILKPYMITNKVLFSRYKDLDFEIISMYEFELLLNDSNKLSVNKSV
ncbi:SEC-C domain-containing protein [Acidaminobacter sp. JC074]|uniref:YecA family protein n=1 Tax=Acidaminobacter sp. JC074 TaxID=2530199 RepID=UPI001F0F5793|nr:SEC-C domain-containing protein [Acidaminobacter sp. JC074]MCH4888932.1 SEC-C domain-containing protein [Acidaminobacter sp. JC074]